MAGEATIEDIGRARAAIEAPGSFCADLTGTLGVFKDIAFIRGSSKVRLNRVLQSPNVTQQHIDGHPLKVLMYKGAEWDFEIGFTTLDAKVLSAVTAAQSGLGLLLSTFLGKEVLATGSTVTGSPTTTSVPTVSAAGFAVGSIVGYDTGVGGALECRVVKSKSSNTLAHGLALSNAPASGAHIIGSASYGLGYTDGSQVQSLQAVVEGQYSKNRYVLMGGQLKSMALVTQLKGLPTFKFTVMFAQWYQGDDPALATDFTATGIGLPLISYTNKVEIPYVNGEFRLFDVGTTTLAGTLVHAPTVTWKWNIAYTEHDSPAGVNGIKQWVRDSKPPVLSGEFVVPRQSETWRTKRDARTAMGVSLQMGTSFTQGALFVNAPTVQITDVQDEPVANLHAQRVSFEARLDEDTSEGSPTDLGKSAGRLALL